MTWEEVQMQYPAVIHAVRPPKDTGYGTHKFGRVFLRAGWGIRGYHGMEHEFQYAMFSDRDLREIRPCDCAPCKDRTKRGYGRDKRDELIFEKYGHLKLDLTETELVEIDVELEKIQ